MAKKLLSVIALMLALVCVLTSCNNISTQLGTIFHIHKYGEWKTVKDATCNVEGIQERTCDCGNKETKTVTTTTNHADMVSKIDNSSYELSYSELYSIYTECINHKDTYNCDLDLTELFEKMLCGKWTDKNDNFITLTYEYEDYNNTIGTAFFKTNLPSSRTSGNTYYYYTEARDGQLIIGYEDRLTEEKTDNFVITFNENKIEVQNKINKKNYYLSINEGYSKVQKGNAKLAYVYIAKKVFDFKNPGSVKVTSCYVDYENKVVYAAIQATNGYGALTTTKYKLYEVGGRCYITEENLNYSTNIDLTELNQKLQEYVSTGG